MPDIDKIIERLLGDRRISEGAAFSSRTFSDQPIIERGSDLKARMERRNAERAARHEQEARERRGAVGQRETVRQTMPRTQQQTPRHAQRTQGNQGTQRQGNGVGQWLRSLNLEEQVTRTLGSIGLDPVPEPIRQMRKLEGEGIPTTLTYGSSAASSLFYRQAQLMEHYRDIYEYHGTFSQYYPTYAAMSDHQLRGYFSWRTRVRGGMVDPAPLSFAFVYVYELLMGIGTTPGPEGLAALRSFGQAYERADEALGARLNNYLRRWIQDYAIYHDIPEAFEQQAKNPLAASALTLLKAEHALLRSARRAPHIPNALAEGTGPSDEELFQALGAASTYHISESRLAHDEPELVRAVACDTFGALVMHCSKRRKTDYVEGLFGYASRTPYTMFSAAVFYQSEPHPDGIVRISDAESYECRNGRWTHVLACDATARNAELGLAMHAVDYQLRERLHYSYPLKQREVPKYLQKMVQDAIDKRLKEREEAERRRITIDLTKLGSIRAAAALTQEALLTDEEREDERPEGQSRSERDDMFHTDPGEGIVEAAHDGQPETSSAGADTGSQEHQTASAQEGLLNAEETRFLAGLLEGKTGAELVGALEQFPSVIADSINEKLFDLVGDAVIEFDGDEPRLIEDYLEDVREVLQP